MTQPDRASPVARVTGIVLAGGRSARFGGDKLAEPYRGIPLLDRAVRGLAEVCDEVVVVIAPDAPELSLPVGVEARFARDVEAFEGPLAGLQAGLAEVGTELAAVLGGDMPEPQPAVLLEMLSAAEVARAEAVVLRDGDRIRPLPCVLRTARALDVAGGLLRRGERRLRNLFDALRPVVIDEPTWLALDPERRTLVDVDEPGDLPA